MVFESWCSSFKRQQSSVSRGTHRPRDSHYLQPEQDRYPLRAAVTIHSSVVAPVWDSAAAPDSMTNAFSRTLSVTRSVSFRTRRSAATPNARAYGPMESSTASRAPPTVSRPQRPRAWIQFAATGFRRAIEIGHIERQRSKLHAAESVNHCITRQLGRRRDAETQFNLAPLVLSLHLIRTPDRKLTRSICFGWPAQSHPIPSPNPW